MSGYKFIVFMCATGFVLGRPLDQQITDKKDDTGDDKTAKRTLCLTFENNTAGEVTELDGDHNLLLIKTIQMSRPNEFDIKVLVSNTSQFSPRNAEISNVTDYILKSINNQNTKVASQYTTEGPTQPSNSRPFNQESKNMSKVEANNINASQPLSHVQMVMENSNMTSFPTSRVENEKESSVHMEEPMISTMNSASLETNETKSKKQNDSEAAFSTPHPAYESVEKGHTKSFVTERTVNTTRDLLVAETQNGSAIPNKNSSSLNGLDKTTKLPLNNVTQSNNSGQQMTSNHKNIISTELFDGVSGTQTNSTTVMVTDVTSPELNSLGQKSEVTKSIDTVMKPDEPSTKPSLENANSASSTIAFKVSTTAYPLVSSSIADVHNASSETPMAEVISVTPLGIGSIRGGSLNTSAEIDSMTQINNTAALVDTERNNATIEQSTALNPGSKQDLLNKSQLLEDFTSDDAFLNPTQTHEEVIDNSTKPNYEAVKTNEGFTEGRNQSKDLSPDHNLISSTSPNPLTNQTINGSKILTTNSNTSLPPVTTEGITLNETISPVSSTIAPKGKLLFPPELIFDGDKLIGVISTEDEDSGTTNPTTSSTTYSKMTVPNEDQSPTNNSKAMKERIDSFRNDSAIIINEELNSSAAVNGTNVQSTPSTMDVTDIDNGSKYSTGTLPLSGSSIKKKNEELKVIPTSEASYNVHSSEKNDGPFKYTSFDTSPSPTTTALPLPDWERFNNFTLVFPRPRHHRRHYFSPSDHLNKPATFYKLYDRSRGLMHLVRLPQARQIQ